MSGKTDVILPEEAVRQDLADIYIGNLNTVDTDLKLPSRSATSSGKYSTLEEEPTYPASTDCLISSLLYLPLAP